MGNKAGVCDRLATSLPDALFIGFDNVPDSAYTTPPLTTVAQSLVGMGALAAELLMKMLDGHPVENRIFELPTHLVVRNSCRAIAPSSEAN